MITLRPVATEDEDFLRAVYASTRADEMELLPASDEEKRAFLDMQFDAQRSDYAARFPDSDHSIILLDGQPIGRIWVGRWEDEIRLLDIALLPEARDAGTGSELLGRLQNEAREAGLPLRHSVYKANEGALRFYERLGFSVVEDFEMYVLMEWVPDG